MDGVLVHSTAVLIIIILALFPGHTQLPVTRCGLGEEVVCKLQAEPNNPFDFPATVKLMVLGEQLFM